MKVKFQCFLNDNIKGLVLEPGHSSQICVNPLQVWKALALEFDDLPWMHVGWPFRSHHGRMDLRKSAKNPGFLPLKMGKSCTLHSSLGIVDQKSNLRLTCRTLSWLSVVLGFLGSVSYLSKTNSLTLCQSNMARKAQPFFSGEILGFHGKSSASGGVSAKCSVLSPFFTKALAVIHGHYAEALLGQVWREVAVATSHHQDFLRPTPNATDLGRLKRYANINITMYIYIILCKFNMHIYIYYIQNII